MRIRKAQISDLDAIISIAEENKLQNDALDNEGFLVSEFTRNDYIDMLKKYVHFYVTEKRGKVCAFAFGYMDSDLDRSLIVNKSIIEYSESSFFIIKQICVSRKMKGKGIATQLYEYLKELIEVPIFVSIVKEPYNEASVNFHLKLQFVKVLEVEAEDGMIRFIYRFSDAVDYDISLIEHQYDTAIELYLHEDKLNWSKLNNLFYISGGLLVALSTISTLSNGSLLYPLLMVSGLGAVSSLLFTITLQSGVKYMNHRKERVMDIERILLRKKGTRVVLPRRDEFDKILKKSPTTIIMIQISRLIFVIWFIVLITAMINNFLS